MIFRKKLSEPFSRQLFVFVYIKLLIPDFETSQQPRVAVAVVASGGLPKFWPPEPPSPRWRQDRGQGQGHP